MSQWRRQVRARLQQVVRWRPARRVPATPIERLRQKFWAFRPVPGPSANVQTMLMLDELRLLESLTDDYWSDSGLIVDAGCFLGGSTVAMASGLRNRGIADRRIIHSFDLFRVEDWTRGQHIPKTMEAGASTRHLFDHNIADFADLVVVHEGDIQNEAWCGEPIEILFIDIAKHWSVCDWITSNLFQHLIPGKSIVVQQDYLCHWWNAWLHITMEYYSDHFERLCDTEYNSVVYLLTRPFPPGALQPDLVANMSREQHIALLDRAASHWSSEQLDLMRRSKANFLEVFPYDRQP
ncbi:hypothetical protein [Blastomonas sp. SL216]|uniref:hypothetical protein n=1 Tax=Blastomonas sp. SL216 TaxID=2995169 RepID=UPI002377A23E|nr:hypothetical protein OU999_05990 [Blastomonas sp. SL216]